MKRNKYILVIVLILSSFFSNAQEDYKRGFALPTQNELAKMLNFQSDYLQGGEKVYALTAKSYGDADASSFDLRDVNGVTPVKSQGNCGACWSFAAMSSIESNNRLNNDEIVDLSEQSLVNCIENTNCKDGGNYMMAFDWFLKRKNSAITENEMPYQEVQQTCNITQGTSSVKIANWQFLGMTPSNSEIKNALVRHGALSAAIYSGFNEFINLKDNVIRGNNFRPDHAITIVGWDDAKEAWLIKNSWGTNWAMNGYGWVGYNSLALTAVAWVDVTRNDVTPEPEIKPVTPTEDLVEIDFVHVLGSLQDHQELFVQIDDQEPKLFGMNKKGVKYHNKIYTTKGRHSFQIITKSIIRKNNKKSMIFGISKGKIKVKEDKAYKLVYKSRVKKSNVFKIQLVKDDIEID